MPVSRPDTACRLEGREESDAWLGPQRTRFKASSSTRCGGTVISSWLSHDDPRRPPRAPRPRLAPRPGDSPFGLMGGPFPDLLIRPAGGWEAKCRCQIRFVGDQYLALKAERGSGRGVPCQMGDSQPRIMTRPSFSGGPALPACAWESTPRAKASPLSPSRTGGCRCLRDGSGRTCVRVGKRGTAHSHAALPLRARGIWPWLSSMQCNTGSGLNRGGPAPRDGGGGGADGCIHGHPGIMPGGMYGAAMYGIGMAITGYGAAGAKAGCWLASGGDLSGWRGCTPKKDGENHVRRQHAGLDALRTRPEWRGQGRAELLCRRRTHRCRPRCLSQASCRIPPLCERIVVLLLERSGLEVVAERLHLRDRDARAEQVSTRRKYSGDRERRVGWVGEGRMSVRSPSRGRSPQPARPGLSARLPRPPARPPAPPAPSAGSRSPAARPPDPSPEALRHPAQPRPPRAALQALLSQP